MAKTDVRTRLAPSPTGVPHVGTAYQALFGYVWARKNNGRFVLRIEDTDRERSSESSERAIIEALRWLGLQWDEGPDVGGEYGPYRQSERVEIYREHVKRLLQEEKAYPCFCSRERLAEMRKSRRSGADTGYDGLCRAIPASEARKRMESGESHTIRLKAPPEGECVFTDLLRGEVRKDWRSVDDQVLLKADGYPTYHLAVVVDDHLMRISHIVRGEEWLNSVPKHILLYQYFGWEVPVMCHLPLLRNKDKGKLSKRKSPTSISYYRDAGFLPQALLNYLAMMGWSHPDGEEKFTLQQMIEHFELEEVSLGGPVFDVDKLRWLNARYIREDHSPRELVDLLEGWRMDRDTLVRIMEISQGRLQTLADWGPLTSPFFTDDVQPDPEDLRGSGLEENELKEMLQLVIWELETVEAFDTQTISNTLRDIAEKLGMKLRKLTGPLYVAISGKTSSTPLFDSMAILGPDMSLVRLRRALESLGGCSKKQRKALEKRHAELFGRET